MKFLWILIVLVNYRATTEAKYQHNNVFKEELVVKELKDSFVNTYFQFTTQWNFKTNELLHTDLISRSISELFLHYDIKELHVSVSNGLWKHEQWGFPVESAGAGGNLYAWFKHHLSQEEITQQWIDLSEALSGLLCASFSFVEVTNTISPQFSFHPSMNNSNSSFIRYASLPREVLCTENLTPWKKLLPCDSQEGFLSLLNAQQIYSTNYHSLAIHVRELCLENNCSDKILESKQTVNLIHDLKLYGGSEWSIRKLFGQGLNGACTLSTSSFIYLDITDKDFEISPKPRKIVTSKRGGSESRFAEFNVKKLTSASKMKMMNIAIVNKKNKQISITSPPPLYSKRFLQGTGKERGKIVIQVINAHWSSLNIIVLENIPWFVPIYLHTLKLEIGNKIVKPKTLKYFPGVQRKQPYHLEVAVTIPARSTLQISIEFDYIFLRWQEYPPDAHHGQYVPSAIISTMLPMALNYTGLPIEASFYAESFNATRPSYFLRIHTEALLINLPTPDFSMPYNVICLACTVVALAFGPLHNMTTKQLRLQKKDDAKKSFIIKLKERLFNKKEKTE